MDFVERYIEENKLPWEYEVCDRCDGHGTHWNPAFCDGITEEERYENWDDESWDDLMTGKYDVPCEECHGLRVVKVVSEVNCTIEQLNDFSRFVDAEMSYLAEREMEIRYGC